MSEHHRGGEGEEREHTRTSDPVLAELVRQVNELASVVNRHLEQERSFQQDVTEAFPEGDFDGHRRAHDSMIRAAVAQEKFWNDLKIDLAKKGVMGVIGALLVLLGLGALVWLQQHLGGH